jgi:HemY protein
MIRVVIFLVAVAIAALGVAWLADRPGEVAITWQNWRIETSLMVTATIILVLVAVGIALWSFLRGIVKSPRRVREYWLRRRGAQGYLAISRGLIAIGAGDTGTARRLAGEAARLAPSEPLTLLLGAQAAQLAGDREGAERAFRAMAGRADTKLLGLRGLFVEAQRRDDAATAKLVAEEAVRSAPSLTWAGQAVLQLRSAAGDWTGALELLERNRKTATAGKADYLRKRAVLLTARALSLEHSDRDVARESALEATKLAPGLVPAAVLSGRFLAEAGDLRKALRVLRVAWKINPHPDLAQTYIHARFGDASRERLARAQELAEETPRHPEAAFAVARAALDAREFSIAREALQPLLERPTRRVAMLMAEIERTEHADEGRSREWTSRALHAAADPAWTADGMVTERWLPMSPVSGRLDAFEWKVPLAELSSGSADRAGTEAAGVSVPVARDEPEPAPLVIESESAAIREPAPSIAAAPEHPAPAAQETSVRAKPAAPFQPPTDIVIPVVHAPDDPGPEPEPESEPGREAEQPGWRGLFR